MRPLKPKFPTLRARSRKVVLLPDNRFFLRSVALTTGDDAPAMAEQIELELELLSPFPLSQISHGYWTVPGVDRALVYATYHKRFTPEEMEDWSDAEWVAPRFASLLAGDAPSPATTWILKSSEGLTAVHFGDDTGVPTWVGTAEWAEDATDREVAEAREQLVRRTGGSKSIVDIDDIAVDPGKPGDEELGFTSADRTARLRVLAAEALDVRDSEELAARRRARVRDQWMWRAAVASVVLIALSVIGEALVFGLETWQGQRREVVAAQVPTVAQIQTADQLVNRIEERSTRRLRPFEMISLLHAPKPDNIVFLRTQTQGVYTLIVEAYSNTQEGINNYISAIDALPGTDSVRMLQLDMNSGRADFQFAVEFNAAAFAAETLVAGGDTP